MRTKKEDFFQNQSWTHSHASRVRRVAFSGDGKFVGTLSSECAKLWKATTGTEVCKIPLESNDVAPNEHFHICLSHSGTLMAIYTHPQKLDLY